MQRTPIGKLPGHTGETITVSGYVHETRSHSNVAFINLRDRTGTVQLVAKPENGDAFDTLPKVSKESVIRATGRIVEQEKAPGGIELLVDSYEVLSEADAQLPIQVNEKGDIHTSLSQRLDHRWLDLRKPDKQLIFKAWTVAEHAMREWWVQRGFTEIHSPKLMGAPSESGAELFALDYFGQTAFLAQSPQFYKQMAMSAGFENVFEIGPVFRAEQSHTGKHQTEFTSVDAEISYIDGVEDVMALEEEWLAYVIGRVKEALGEEIEERLGVEVGVPETPFPRITFSKVRELLGKRGGDFSSDEEKELAALAREKYGHEFLFVTHYPASIRPFYHMRDGETTRSFDLFWSGLEITTGAQREHRYDVLRAQAEEDGLDLSLISDYLSFFKHGCPPHGGYGFGPARFVMRLLGLENIREATFLPRDPERLTP